MSKGQVLLAGGDYDVTHALWLYLDAHGFDVPAVLQKDEVLTACRRSAPDAIILGPGLFDVNCSDICHQIRADDQTKQCFLLVLLLTDTRDEKLAALEAGVDDVMVYPIDFEEVRLKIEGVLGLCSS